MFINVNDGRKCQACEDLLPGCGECEQTDFPPTGAASVLVGYDSTIANKNKGRHVICNKCAKDTMFEVTFDVGGVQ